MAKEINWWEDVVIGSWDGDSVCELCGCFYRRHPKANKQQKYCKDCARSLKREKDRVRYHEEYW